MNETISEEQAVLSTLSPVMRRALLTAVPAEPEPEWDTVADYCQGHESLRGDLMGASQYCEGEQVCRQAREAYKTDREPDHDQLFITISPDVTIGSVVALIGRGLCETAAGQSLRKHELTERGMAVFHHLKALQQRGQAGTERVNRRAARLAHNLAERASTHHVLPHTVSTVMLLLVREGMVKGAQAELFNDVMQELDKQAVGR